MSKFPGTTLELFLAWWFDVEIREVASVRVVDWSGVISKRLIYVTPAQFQPIVALFETQRSEIERLLSWYDRETSWRDYASTAFDLDDELEKQAWRIRDTIKASLQI